MSISSTVRKAGPFIGNGSAATFSFGFKVFTSADLSVLLLNPNGIQSTLALTTDYTVALNPNQDSNPGGSITLVAGVLASGYSLVVTTAIPELQGVVLQNLGAFYPDVINDALDRLTILVQQVQEQLDRALRFPASDNTAAELGSAIARAGKLLYFGADGSPTLLSTAPTGGLIDPSQITAGTFTGAGTWTAPQTDAQGTVTDSTVNNPMLRVTRTDNSAPVSGAGILNGWLAPMVRLDLTTQSGGVTGSQMGLLVDLLGVKGKTWTTTTQSITASGSPQTITVADSSAFGLVSPDNQATIDPGQGSAITETVSVTAIPDSTHITAVFAHNHTSGARIGVLNRGYKSAAGFAIGDVSGNTNDINGSNPNCTVNGSGIQAVCGEDDITTNVTPGNYYGDRTGPWTVGHAIINAGSHDSSVGLFIGTSSGATNLRVAAEIGSASAAGVVIENAGGGVPPTGIAIQSAGTNGIIIGSDQSTITNPNFSKSDPTNGIVLTSKGSAANASSNTLRLESYDSGAVKHTFDIQHAGNAKAITLLYGGVDLGTRFNFDGSVQSTQFQLRDTGTNTTRGKLYLSGTTSAAEFDVVQFSSSFDTGLSRGAAGQVNVGNGTVGDASGTIVSGASKIGTGTTIIKFAKYTATLSPAAVAANTTAAQTFTVTGVAIGDTVVGVSKPSAQAGLGIVGWFNGGPNAISIVFSNNTGSPITPTASELYAFEVIQ